MACAADIILSFLQSIVFNPPHALKKDMKSSNNGIKPSEFNRVLPPPYKLNGIPGAVAKLYREGDYHCYIADIQEEKIIVLGKETKVPRVFVNFVIYDDQRRTSSQRNELERSTHVYTNVGWIINSEVSHCMVCMTEFGMFTYAHHCKACGNVVCQKCSNDKVTIHEIREIGRAVRVCVQCFWGQEVVNCVQNRKLASEKPAVVAANSNKVEPTLIDPKVAEEEAYRKQKLAEQQRFISEANRRSNGNTTTPKPNRKSSIFGYDDVYQSNGDFVVEEAEDNSAEAYYEDSAMDFNDIYSSPESNKSIIHNEQLSLNDTEEMKYQQRVLQIASYGPIRVVKPTPSFVMKTKRNNGTKIFVNVCLHDFVPFGSSDKGLDDSKLVYMVVSAPLEHQNEKDGSYCVVYDVVISPQEVAAASNDETGRVRGRICSQALVLIAAQFGEELDSQYRVLRLSNNYKGASDDLSPVRSCAIPHQDAFFALHQIFLIPSDVELINNTISNNTPPSDSSRNSTKKGLPEVAKKPTNGSQKPSAAGEIISIGQQGNGTQGSALSKLANTVSSERNSASDRTREMQTNTTGSFLVVESTKRNNLNNVIKFLVKPQSASTSSAASFNNNFNDVLNDLNRYEQEYNDMILKPEAGFVIAARRLNQGQKIYVNVCHHKKVGLLTAAASGQATYSAQLNEDGSLVDENFPYIIGSINKLLDKRPSVGNKEQAEGDKILAVTIDVVIPSSLWNIILKYDETGDIRENISIGILKNLSAQNIEFDPTFDLPIIKGGYMSCNNLSTILPVINLSEQEKPLYKLSFVGKFFKQGHGVKSWKERVVHIVDSKIYYFDVNATNKGDFRIDDCAVQNVPSSECNAPEDSFAFKILNRTPTAVDYLYCYVLSEELRHFFALVLLCKARQMSIKRDLSQTPDAVTGWLKAMQGSVIKSWKRRYFMLSYGQIYFFDAEPKGGEKPAGNVDLTKAEVKVIINNAQSDHKMVVVDKTSRELILQADSLADKKLWFEAIKAHIEYANGN